MIAKRPRQISRSTSMSRFHFCTEKDSVPLSAPPAINFCPGFEFSQESPPPIISQRMKGSTEARSETSPSSNRHENVEVSEFYEISLQDEANEGGQLLLDNDMLSTLQPPSEPSSFALRVGLYSVVDNREPRTGARVETPHRACKETALIECSRCFPLLEIASETNVAAADSRPLSDFLDACFICKRQLGQGSDTYMYRGERAFCSMECRTYQIRMEKVAAFKKGDSNGVHIPIHKRKIIAGSSSTTCA